MIQKIIFNKVIVSSAIKEYFIKIITLSLIYILNSSVSAFKNNFQQPIQINSSKQLVDFKKNITTFMKCVMLTQGAMNIKADKVIVANLNRNTKKIIIKAYGKPAVFHQSENNNKSITGYSNKIIYEADKKLIILIGNACFGQENNNIKGDKIIYSIPNQELQAFSNKQKEVSTILLPF